MKDFRGTGVAMITPFNTAGEVDYGVLSSLVESYIQSGIDFLVVLGTTAETVTLSQEEQIKVTRKVAEINAGRLPLMLGKGGNNTHALVNDLKATDFFLATALFFLFVPIIIDQIKKGFINTFLQ